MACVFGLAERLNEFNVKEIENEMPQKTVLIIEDQPGMRSTYYNDLKKRGFEVEAPQSVAEARKVVNELGERIDVAFLDMRLDNYPDGSSTTGAQIGLELKEKCTNCTPEFLIRSEFPEVDYYKQALELGAAAYLPKHGTDLSDVIRYVRVLTLRRLLKIENPTVVDQLSRIAATTKNVTDSVLTFCKQTLEPSMSSCLGAPFILLLTDENGTQNCATNADLPLGFQGRYEILQALTHGNADLTDPYRFDVRNIGETRDATERHIVARLEGAVFVPLASVYEYRLSLGILTASPQERFPEDPHKLALVVARYVRSTICDNFIKIFVQLDIKRRTTLGSTSQFCLFLGQDQRAIVDEGVRARDLKDESVTHQRLRLMAEDLEETGTILMNVAQAIDDKTYMQVKMRELIEETWRDLREAWTLKGIDLRVEGDCSVLADEVDLSIIVARVLQWLAQRKVATEPPHEPMIKVLCEEGERNSRIVFEDCSRRLPQRLRERLFEPFTLAVQSARSLPMPSLKSGGRDVRENESSRGRPGYLPLYLAKTLVEEKYQGWLEDKSDEMEGEAGHRLVMQFHRSYAPATMTAGKH